MKKAQREIYLILSNEVDYSICCFCKFAEGYPCGGIECHHALSDRCGFPYEYGELYPGDDCWGFRPLFDVSMVADIVGIILANGWDSTMWTEDDEGHLLISGSTGFKGEY